MEKRQDNDVVAPHVGDVDLDSWRKKGPFLFSLAKGVCWLLPRGKGRFARWFGRTFGQGLKASVRSGSGALVAIDPSNLDIYMDFRQHGGFWEHHVLKACVDVLRPGDVFFDVGANAGFFSVEVANLPGKKVSVFAFEPQPSLARAAAISALLNDFENMSVFQMMVGKKEGTGELYVPSQAVFASAVAVSPDVMALPCVVTNVDALVCTGRLPAPNVVKIDVEGAELDVVVGARETIRRHAPYLIFESDQNSERFNYTRSELCSYLSALADYRFFLIGKKELEPLRSVEGSPPGNVLAAPSGRPNPPRTVTEETVRADALSI
jgi:FkbM family methyltransferase